MSMQLTPTPPNDFHRLIVDLVRRSIQEVEQTIQQIESLKQQSADPSQTAFTILQRILEEEKIQLPPLLFNRWADRLTGLMQKKQVLVVRRKNEMSLGSYLILGRNAETDEDVNLKDSARGSGLNLVGVAGSGKSTVLENIVVADAKNGHGVFFVDVQGDSTEHILSRLPDDRLADVILLEPGANNNPFGINLLAHSGNGVDHDVDVCMSVIRHISGVGTDQSFWGPRLATVLRNGLYVLYYNELTLAELPILLRDKDFRAAYLKNIPPEARWVTFFFEHDFNNLSSYLQMEHSESTLNKVYQLLSIKEVEYVISQQKTTIDFRHMMDERKIVLLKLPKHTIGEDAVTFLGTVAFTSLLDAARSRADVAIEDRPFFSVVIDEFGNFASPLFSQMLPELRKYNLSFTLAYQFLAQLDEENRGATQQLANQMSFRVRPRDAETLAHFYAKEPPPAEPRYENKRVISPTPVDTIVLYRPHTNPVVNDFFKLWRNIVDTSRSPIREGETPGSVSSSTNLRGVTRIYSRPGHSWSNRLEVEMAKRELDFLNSFFYQVMVQKNPYSFVPLIIFAKYSPLVGEYAIGIAAQEKDQQHWQHYINLWEAQTEEQLLQAFADYEHDIRMFLKEQLESKTAIFLEQLQKSPIGFVGGGDGHPFLEQLELTANDLIFNPWYGYEYAWNDQGKVVLVYWMNKLHKQVEHILQNDLSFLHLTVQDVLATPVHIEYEQLIDRGIKLYSTFTPPTAPRFPVPEFSEMISTLAKQTYPYYEPIDWWFEVESQDIQTILREACAYASTLGFTNLHDKCPYQWRDLHDNYLDVDPNKTHLEHVQDSLQMLNHRKVKPNDRPSFCQDQEHFSQTAEMINSLFFRIEDAMGMLLPPHYKETQDWVFNKIESTFSRWSTWLQQRLQSCRVYCYVKFLEIEQREEDVTFQMMWQPEKWVQFKQRQLEDWMLLHHSDPSHQDTQTYWSILNHNPNWRDVDEKHKPKSLTFIPQQKEVLWKHATKAIQAEIDRIITEKKPPFEQAVRDVRQLMSILVQEPVMELSSVLEEKPGTRRSIADMVNDMAQELINLPNRIAYVKLGASGEDSVKLQTLPLEPGCSLEELEQRKRSIAENTLPYTTNRDEVEKELQQRHAAYTKSGSQQPQTKPVPQPIQEKRQVHYTTRRVCAVPDTFPTLQHPVVFSDEKTTADTYLSLLYYFSYLTLQQAVKLTGKQTSINNERTKLTKLVKDGLVISEAMKESISSGRAALAYSLSAKGYKYLETEKGLSPQKKGDYTKHSYLVNEVLITAILSAKTQNTIQLVGFEHEKMFRMKPIQLSNGKGVEPDSLLMYRVGQNIAPIALECDLNIETREQLTDKIQKYLQALLGPYKERYGVDALSIAFVIPNGSENDIARLVGIIEAAVEHDKEAAPLFFVGAFDPLQIEPKDVLFAPLFTQPFGKEKHALIETSS